MGAKVAIALLGIILKSLNPETMRKIADQMLDTIEKEVAESHNKIDDAIVLPLCATAREAFGISDDD